MTFVSTNAATCQAHGMAVVTRTSDGRLEQDFRGRRPHLGFADRDQPAEEERRLARSSRRSLLPLSRSHLPAHWAIAAAKTSERVDPLSVQRARGSCPATLSNPRRRQSWPK
jgi:hypothetical protein